MVKKQGNMSHTFLTISSRPGVNYKSVYHPILQEVKIYNKRSFKDS